MQVGRVYGRAGKTALGKTRGLRAGLARLVDTLPEGAPRVGVAGGPEQVAEELTRVEDWLELARPRFDRGPVRALRRLYEAAVWA